MNLIAGTDGNTITTASLSVAISFVSTVLNDIIDADRNSALPTVRACKAKIALKELATARESFSFDVAGTDVFILPDLEN